MTRYLYASLGALTFALVAWLVWQPSTVEVVFGGTGTAGYTSIGASDYADGTSSTCNYPGLLITIPQAGTISKVTAHVKNTIGVSNGVIRLYAGSAGSRGASIADSDDGNITTSYGWVDFSFASPVSVSATTYWIQFMGVCGNGPGGNLSSIKYDTGGAANSSYALSDAQVPQYGTDRYSMYATYSYTDPVVTTAATSTVINNAHLIISNGRLIK